MRCQSCGAVIDDNTTFCPICGARQDPSLRKLEQRYGTEQADTGNAEQYYSDYSAGGRVGSLYESIFREPLFLAITIMMTVAAAITLFTGVRVGESSYGLNLGAAIPILYAVALWMIFAEFRKNTAQHSTTGLAIASGTTKAVFIITWVAVVMVAVLVVILVLFGNLLVNYLPYPFIQDLPDILDIPGITGASYVPMQAYQGINTAVVLGIVFVGALVIAALIVVNLCFYKKLHRLTKSACESLKYDHLQIECVKPVKAWLIVFAVVQFLGALGSVKYNPLGVVSGLCEGLSSVFASVLIRKYFGERVY